jgi:hypothetical protein
MWLVHGRKRNYFWREVAMALTILQKQVRIGQRLKKAHEDLKDLQALCKHESATVEHKSDTGNYDPSQNAYWNEWICHECGKRWTTRQ